MIYYISDLHLNDERVFKLCNRPFKSVDGLFDELVKRWNQKVRDTDEVYILGDLLEGPIEIAIKFFSLVKGKKHLVVGNHDENKLCDYYSSNIFISINHIVYLNDDGRKVILCHYPLLDWQSGEEPIHHIFGHIHNKYEQSSWHPQGFMKNYYYYLPAYNASIDVTNFEPVTLDELIVLKEEQL